MYWENAGSHSQVSTVPWKYGEKEEIKMIVYGHSGESRSDNFRIIMHFWETAHLPLPSANILP